MNAALCLANENIEVNDANSNIGACTDRSGYGSRPRCWFYNANEGGGASGKVSTPLLNGQPEVATSDANAKIFFTFDIRNFSGAEVTGIELSNANQPFPNPNGTEPAPNVRYRGGFDSTFKTLEVFTSKLPARGTYYFRIIPLTRDGKPLAPWSNSSILHFN